MLRSGKSLFSLIVKNAGLRNCQSPELKTTIAVSIACDAGLFVQEKGGIPCGVRKALSR